MLLCFIQISFVLQEYAQLYKNTLSFIKMKFKSIKMLKLLKLLILICTFALQEVISNYISIDLSIQNSQINIQTAYTFTFARDLNPLTSDFVTPATIPVGSVIQIVFPNDYSGLATSSTVPCSDVQTGIALSCEVTQANNTITIKNYYLNASTTGNLYPSIKVSSIINPGKSGQTQNFVYYIKNSIGTIIDQSPAASNTIYFPRLTFTPGTFQSFKLSAQAATILTRSKLYLSLTPKNRIPSNGKIVIQLPLTWANNIETNMTVITAPNCAAIENMSATVSCSYYFIASPVNKVYITIIGLSTNSLSTPFSLSVQSILTPPIVDSSQSVIISSQSSDGSQIDVCSVTISDLTPIKFQSASFVSTTQTVVQTSFVGLMSLSIARPFSHIDTIVFTLPSFFMNANITSTGFVLFSPSKDTSSSSITLSNFPSGSNKSPGTPLNFTFENIVNPTSVNPVTIVASFYRLGSLYQQQTLQYRAVKGAAAGFKLFPTTSPIVYAKGTAQMQIQTNLMIPTGSIIKVSYPSTVTASDFSTASIGSALLNGISVSSSNYMISSNTIIFSNIFQSNFVNGTILVDFSEFQNPPSVQPSDYLLTVETSDGHDIFTGTFTITATLKRLIRNQITSSSVKVLSTSVITANLQLNHLATTISIIIPSQIWIRAGFQVTCNSTTISQCGLIGNNLTFRGNFQSGMQTLSWGNTRNPNSLQPSQTFSVFTYNRGWGVQTSLGQIFLQMAQTVPFSSILIIPSTLKNNQNINVGFTINLPSGSPEKGQISITFPSEIDISQSSCNITCIKISRVLTFEFTTAITKMDVTISNVINSPSFKPNSDFQFTLINENLYGSLSQAKSSWTNNIASTFQSQVTTANAYRGQNALFKFKLTGLSGKQTYIKIKFNDLFGILTAPPVDGVLLGPRSVRLNIVNRTSSDQYLTLLTPSIWGDYAFQMSTHIEQGGESYLISESTSNLWRHSCFESLCRQCDSTNTSKCINCYNDSISEYDTFDTSLLTCKRDCTQGFFLTSGTICSPCGPSCLQCANTSTNCTACTSGGILFLDTTYNKCVSSCQDGQYKNLQIQQCRECTSPCLYCEGSATRCTYCKVGQFLLNQNCLARCPTTGVYIQNSVLRKCDLCNANCLKCQNSTTTCTSCNKSLLLFLENNICVSICKLNSFIDIQAGLCVQCKSPCNICHNDSNVCSSCLTNISNFIWYNYGCIAQGQCPLGNFVNTANKTCDQCLSSCFSCTNKLTCTACQLNFALHQGACISPCPNTTYEDTRVCLPCQGCETCLGNYTNCTSCISSQFLYTGKCYTICPDGTFANQTLRVCILCPSDCPTCRNSTFCLTCISDLFMYVGKCYQSCPILTFQTTQSSVKICKACPQTCSECTSMQLCRNCKIGFNLQNDSVCVATCSKGIAFNQICYTCGLNCADCNQVSQNCQQCVSNYLLYQGRCLVNCPSNTLSLNNKTCVSCTFKFGQNCTTCSINECLSCSDGELINGQCQPCAEGYYSRSSKCAKCPHSCSSCNNQTNCIACADNFYMEQNYCTNVCPLNKIPNGKKCTICIQSCSICNLNNSLCSVCNSGHHLYESRCVLECPTPLIVNLNSTVCVTEEAFYEEYSKQAKIVYFPFSIAGIVLFTIGIVIKCYSNLTHLVTFACAVISIAQIGGWAAFTYVQFMAFNNYHPQSFKGFLLAFAGILLLMIIAGIHTKFYCKYITSDSLFLKWQKSNFCVDKFFLSLSIVLNFKFYRIVHSRLLQREQFSMRLTTLNKLLPFSLLSIASLLVCSLPVIIGSGLALYFSISQDQQFFAALDCLTITSIMIMLTLLDLRHESTYFVVEVESANLKRQIYEQDSFKMSIDGQIGDDERNMSKAELLLQVKGQTPGQSATKLRGQSQLLSTGFNQTKPQSLFKNKGKQEIDRQEDLEQINIDNQQLDFHEISQDGDDAVYVGQHQGSEKHLMDQQEEDEPKREVFKWVQKKYDRHGYLIKKNQMGEQQRYDEDGYKVIIGEDGIHRKYDSDGNQVQQLNGEFYIKDSQGFYCKQGKRYDERGYEVRANQDGEIQYFDQSGFKVVEDQQGNIKLFDQYGHQVIKDAQGNIHRYTPQNYEAFVSKTGKITYTDKQGNHIRKNQKGQFQMYDPDDGFKIVKGENGQILKFDKYGYRVQKDKWGNIYRYDQQGYRIVFGPGNKVTRFDKNGYEVRIAQNGQVKLINKEGYQVKIDQDGNTRFFDENGYQVVTDYDGQITLYDSKGYEVIIDKQTGQHKKFTSQGLRVVQKDSKTKFYDRRGHEVVQLEDGSYEKYDEAGNLMDLDEFGFQVQQDQHGQKIRYDKVGNLVNEQQFQQKLKQEQVQIEQLGQNAVQKIKRFKPKKQIDLQAEYSKMVLQQNNIDQQSLQEQDNLHQFHEPQVYKQTNLEQQLQELKNQVQQNQIVYSNDHFDLNQLQEVDHNPHKNIKEKTIHVKPVRKNGQYRQGDALEDDISQDYVEVKSIADASINERSFENEGVQPIDAEDSQYSQLQSLDELSPNWGKPSKRKRGQHSQLSFIHGQTHDTKTEYNHKKVNVQIKNKNLYDQNEEIESLNEQNWAQNAQGGMFYNYNKDLSKANTKNTNTYKNQLIYMDQEQNEQDALSSFVKQNTNRSHNHSPRNKAGRYDYQKNTIEQMENELFQKQIDEGIRERTQFKLANGPNPLVQYAKNLQSNKKSLQERIYLQQTRKKKKRR